MGGKIRISLTNQCNYSCSFCHREGLTASAERSEIAKDDLALLINRFYAAGFRCFQFTGGEPLCHRERIDTLLPKQYLKQYPDCEFALITNGFLAYTKRMEILNSCIQKMKISFHAYSDEVMYKVQGIRGINMVKKAVVFFSTEMPIVLNYLALEENYSEFDSILNFCIVNKVNLSVLPYVSSLANFKRKNDEIRSRIINKFMSNSIEEKIIDRTVGANRLRVNLRGVQIKIYTTPSSVEIGLCSKCSDKAICYEKLFAIRISPKQEALLCLLSKKVVDLKTILHNEEVFLGNMNNFFSPANPSGVA